MDDKHHLISYHDILLLSYVVDTFYEYSGVVLSRHVDISCQYASNDDLNSRPVQQKPNK